MTSRESGSAGNKRIWLSAVLASTLLTACGSNAAESTPSNIEEVQPPAAATLGSSAVGEGLFLIFDDLGGGSSIIRVYPGVQDAEADKQANGTFRDGDVVPAICKAVGREVSSNPSVGERVVTSDEWIRIQGSPGETQYATGVYIKNPDELLGKLPVC